MKTLIRYKSPKHANNSFILTTQVNIKNKEPNKKKKWAKGLNRHFSKERYIDGQKVHEKMLNITNN